MKRFDVCPARGMGIRGKDRLVVILQHEHFDDFDTILVAPLYGINDLPKFEHFRPEIKIGRTRYVIVVDRLAAIAKSKLGAPLGSAALLHFELLRATDRLFSGF